LTRKDQRVNVTHSHIFDPKIINFKKYDKQSWFSNRKLKEISELSDYYISIEYK